MDKHHLSTYHARDSIPSSYARLGLLWHMGAIFTTLCLLMIILMLVRYYQKIYPIRWLTIPNLIITPKLSILGRE